MMRLDVFIPCTRLDNLDNLLNSINDQKIDGTRVTVYNDKRDPIIRDYFAELAKNRTYEGKMYINYQERQEGEPSGAARARNKAYQSLVDDKYPIAPYIIFIDDDCRLLPGVIQNMIDIIGDDDFVYGNYEFENGQKFISRTFNPYVLKTHNYISTMTLMKKEVFGIGFNEKLEFFQDWDFFYRAVQLGFKGKYLNEIIFRTKSPDKDSISGNTMSLSEKSKVFREANNITDSKLVVSTFGCQLQAEQRAEMLNADYAGVMNSQGGIFPVNLQYDTWTHSYMIGCFNSPLNALVNHLKAMYGKKIVHFVGTDVFHLMEKHSWTKLQLIKERFKDEGVKLLCNSSTLHKELVDMGFDVELVYTPLYKSERFEQAPLPDDFTVGVYYSDTPNMNFFDTQEPMNNNNGESNLYLIWEVVKAMPHIKFAFFGSMAKFKTENVTFHGRIPNNKMPEFINSCSTLIRCTPHDGNAHLPLQYMLSGRRVITNTEYPLIGKMNLNLSFKDILHYENCKNEIINKIKECRELGPLNNEELNFVRQFVYSDMSVDKYRKEIRRIMEEM